ncbi:MAG: YidH family protein [Planctomycetota bacterium]
MTDPETESTLQEFSVQNHSLNERLALDRTIMANERTLLAYLRSGLALLLAGATIIHFARGDWFRYLGVLSLPAGIATIIIAVLRYRLMHQRIQRATKNSPDQNADCDGGGKKG